MFEMQVLQEYVDLMPGSDARQDFGPGVPTPAPWLPPEDQYEVPPYTPYLPGKIISDEFDFSMSWSMPGMWGLTIWGVW